MKNPSHFFTCWLVAGVFTCLGSSRGLGGEDKLRVVVLPLSSLGTTEQLEDNVRNQLIFSLAKKDLEVLPVTSVDAAVAGLCKEKKDWWECLERDENLFEIGRRLNAKAVIAGKLAVMGKNLVLKLRMADAASDRISSEVINASVDDDKEILGRFILLFEQLFVSQPVKPWYQRWETWTIGGAGVAAVVTTVLVIVLKPGSSNPWDFRRSLP
jgi:TolB-like protein